MLWMEQDSPKADFLSKYASAAYVEFNAAELKTPDSTWYRRKIF